MVYRVILTFNGVYKSTLYRRKTKKNAFIKFYKIKEDNKVLFPKKFVNDGCIKPTKYEIKITKITEETDTFRTLRNEYGKTYVEKPLGDWTILHSDNYEIEETFCIFQPVFSTIKSLLFLVKVLCGISIILIYKSPSTPPLIA